MRQRRTYKAIQECHQEQGVPIEAACKLLHVARSAYHKWATGKRSRRATENERLCIRRWPAAAGAVLNGSGAAAAAAS